MMEGMAHLLGLRPPPDDWTLASFGKAFGILPSRLKAEDYRWLAVSRDMEWLRSAYQIWTSAGAKRVSQMLTPKEMLCLSELKKEAQRLYGREDDTDNH